MKSPGVHQRGFCGDDRERLYRADRCCGVHGGGFAAAGTDYQDWLLDVIYSCRILHQRSALARDLTATQPTPYDRAVASRVICESFH